MGNLEVVGNGRSSEGGRQGRASTRMTQRRTSTLDRSPIRSLYNIAEPHNAKVEVYDVWRSSVDRRLVFRWRPARIRELTVDVDSHPYALVAFNGFSERWDTWIRLDEGKIRPPRTAHGFSAIEYLGVQYPSRSNEVSENTSSGDEEGREGEEEEEEDEEPSFSSLQAQSGLEASVHANVRLIFRRKPLAVPKLSTTPPAPGNQLRGLVNLGNTCFFNAVLQCLSSIQDLRQYFLTDQFKDDDQNRLARKASPSQPVVNLAQAFSSFLDAQENHHEANNYSIEPALRGLWTAVVTALPQFGGNVQHDAQEVLVAFLDRLHDTLNRIGRKPTYVEINPPVSLGQSELADVYWDNYERGNDSILKDIFCGQLMSRLACLECGANSTSFDAFWQLSVSFTSHENNSSVENVKSLLNGFFCLEAIENYYCGRCQQEREGRRQFSVTRWPNVLVVHVKRFEKNHLGDWVKRNDPVNVDFTLEFDGGKVLYNLKSLVVHSGVGLSTGHYWSFVSTPQVGGGWMRCDDDKVSEVATSKVASEGGGYLYFYDLA